MSPKERLLSAISGDEVDRVPWSPFLAYYWDFMPDEVKTNGEFLYLEQLGADPLLRGQYPLFQLTANNVSYQEVVRNHEKWSIYETPVGTLTSKHVFSQSGKTWFLVEHAVKNKEDFQILAYMNENVDIKPDFEAFDKQSTMIGDRGLILPPVGTDWLKTPFQSLVEKWVGTEQLVYALADYPEQVEDCLQTMSRNADRVVRTSCLSGAEGFIFWEDSSTTNVSPTFYEKYIAPDIRKWSKIIHLSDKFLVQHACGHLRDILSLMCTTGIDMVESISPPPTGNIELWEARSFVNEKIGFIGGIEPTVFLGSTLVELEAYVVNLLGRMRNTRFILANSDSCPPGVEEDKFRMISRIVREFQ